MALIPKKTRDLDAIALMNVTDSHVILIDEPPSTPETEKTSQMPVSDARRLFSDTVTVGIGQTYETHAEAYASGVRVVEQKGDVTEVVSMSATEDYTILGGGNALFSSFIFSNSTTNKISFYNLTVTTSRVNFVNSFIKCGTFILNNSSLISTSTGTTKTLVCERIEAYNYALAVAHATSRVGHYFKNGVMEWGKITLNQSGDLAHSQLNFDGTSIEIKNTEILGTLNTVEFTRPAILFNTGKVVLTHVTGSLTGGRLSCFSATKKVQIAFFSGFLYLFGRLPVEVLNSDLVRIQPHMTSTVEDVEIINSFVYFATVGSVSNKTLNCIDSKVRVLFTTQSGAVSFVLKMLRGILYGTGLSNTNFSMNHAKLDTVNITETTVTRLLSSSIIKDCTFAKDLTISADSCTVRGNRLNAGTITINATADDTIVTENRTNTAIMDNSATTILANNI